MVLIIRSSNWIPDGDREPKQGNGISALKGVTGAALLAAALLLTLAARSSATTSPRRIEIQAKRFAFEPAEIAITAGQNVDLVLNTADVPHGMRFHEFNFDLHASKGKPAEVRFTPDQTGTFVGHCSVFCGSGHGKMTLTIHVVD